MAKAQDNGSHDAPDHIEQIRDIIFGPQQREYDQRLDQILSELHRLQNESRAQAEELRESLQAKFSAGLDSLEREMRQMGSQLQLEASNLRKEIDRAEKKSSTDIADARSKLQSELRLTTEQLSRDLQSQASAARDRDVSRESLAEILEEFAMKLKGVDLLNELKKATSRKAGE